MSLQVFNFFLFQALLIDVQKKFFIWNIIHGQEAFKIPWIIHQCSSVKVQMLKSYSLSIISQRSSEIHLFYNLQIFYWHFIEILWLFIFLVLYLWFILNIIFLANGNLPVI